MSKKVKNKEIESTQCVTHMSIPKPNKEKHNSKRRRCKKKTLTDSEGGSDINKVDEVVNFLCNTIIKNNSESSLGNSDDVRIDRESPKIVKVCLDKNHIPNSQCNITNHPVLSSAKDLDNLFENLQIHTSKNPITPANMNDFLNIDLLKKTKCDSLSIEDLERLKQEKLKKTCSLNEEKTCVSNECLKEYFNLNLIRDSPRTSVLTQIDSSSMRLVSEIEQTFYSNSPDIDAKSQKNNFLKEYFNVDALMREENNLVTSIKSTSKLLVKELESKLLKNETQECSKKFQKKKTRHKKSKDLTIEKEFSNCQKVFLNSDLQKTSSSKPSSSASQCNKHRKNQHNSKWLPTKDYTKFPEYSSPEEFQSLSNFGALLTGIIRINQKNYKEAYITAPDKGMDILIEGLRDRNRALEGDEVYFVLKAKEHHRVSTVSTDIQRTAVVVGIKTLNHNRGAIGTLNVIKNKNNNFALFSPRDSRLPRIRIKKSSWPLGFVSNSESFKNKLYFAKISQWTDLRFADGEILKEVGVAGDLKSETDAILLKYDLDITPYSETLKHFIPSSAFRISEYDIQNREDFRKDCTFTIDPQSAVDLDDAVSCKHLSNGNFEVGVHISDVSFFLEEGTPLDKVVCERATTIYLVQEAYHMLPFELCRICSLTPGEDKLSFSVLWEITPDCKILKHRFARSVINSCAKFSYEQVQAVIDNLPSSDFIFPKIHGTHSSENIKEIIMFLHKVAICLRNRRFRNGALRIDQKKINFILDENKLPLDYKEEIHGPSHQLIEEFMLLANITVAEKLNSRFPELAFLRSHPPPLPYVLEKLQKTFEKYGIILDISSSGSLQASLLKYSGDESESVARMLVINNALAKPMARAKYYCSGLFLEEIDRRHYALSVPLYTHFTSPIRRYADIMVHRLLAASLDYCERPNWTADHVQFIAANCNKKKYAAKMAQEMSIELYFSLFIGLKGTTICEAVVCDIKDKSFDCIGLSTGIHQRIYFEHIKGDIKKEKEDGILRLIIKWPKNGNYDTETVQIIEMFSIVKIELKRVNVLKIEAKLLRTC